MEIVSKKDFLKRKEFYLSEIKIGKIFVYPTDTIYGIGCDATNSEAVLKIREAKQRNGKPFSVIAPSKEWIIKNCLIDAKNKWLEKIPGKYTLILRLINKDSICGETNDWKETLGVRIPDNWFAGVVEKSGKPFVTTSVNLSGENPINSISDLNESIKDKIDYFVDDGILIGKPSMIVDLTGTENIIYRR